MRSVRRPLAPRRGHCNRPRSASLHLAVSALCAAPQILFPALRYGGERSGGIGAGNDAPGLAQGRLVRSCQGGAGTWIFTSPAICGWIIYAMTAFARARTAKCPRRRQMMPPTWEALLITSEREERLRTALQTLSSEQEPSCVCPSSGTNPHADRPGTGDPAWNREIPRTLALAKLRAALDGDK